MIIDVMDDSNQDAWRVEVHRLHDTLRRGCMMNLGLLVDSFVMLAMMLAKGFGWL